MSIYGCYLIPPNWALKRLKELRDSHFEAFRLSGYNTAWPEYKAFRRLAVAYQVAKITSECRYA